MVTLQAKEETQQNQQQELQSSRDKRVSERSTVADDDRSRKQRETVVNGDRDNEIIDNWKCNDREFAELTNDQRDDCDNRNQDISLVRDLSKIEDQSIVWRDVNGSNSDSTQCSEIDDDNYERNERDDDNNERNENLCLAAEEEEDDNDDDEGEEEIENTDGWIRRKVITTSVQQEANFDESNDQAVQQVMPNLDETSFGEINITSSKHVHVGNTNFYKGPVTIKQFVYTNAYPAYEKTHDTIVNHIGEIPNGRISDTNPNNVNHSKGDPNGPILPTHRDYEKVTQWLWTWRCAAILCVLTLSLVTMVVVVSVLFSNEKNFGSGSGLPDQPTSGVDPNDEIWVDSVRFIERDWWNAQPPVETLKNLSEVPVPYVIISHTASAPCTQQSECVSRVRMAQTLHIESFGWSDIGYNFLVGGDGNAYVGRGWDAEGAHSFGWNSKSLGISFIGTFNDVPPYKKQLHAALKVIEAGLKLGKISPSYKLLGHRQVSNTLSPGDKLYKILQTWDHWSPIPRPSISSSATTINRSAYPPLVFVPSVLLTLPQLLLIVHLSVRLCFQILLGRALAR